MKYLALVGYVGLGASGVMLLVLFAAEGYRALDKALYSSAGKRTAGDAAGRPAALTAAQPHTTTGAGVAAGAALVASPVPPVP